MHLVVGAVAAFLLKNSNFRQAFGIWRLKQAVEAWEKERDRQVVVRHRLPGRLRLGVVPLAGDSQFAQRLEGDLGQLDGVHQVQANVATGGLLVEYDSDTIDETTLTSRVFASIAPLTGSAEQGTSAAGIPADPNLFQMAVIHSLPGRVRLHVPIIRYLDGHQPMVVEFFQNQEGIDEINLNPVTATALVRFDEGTIDLGGVLNLVGTSLDMVRDSICPVIPEAAQLPSALVETGPLNSITRPASMPAPHQGWNGGRRSPVRPRTVQERSMYEESSQEKLVDVLISGITFGLSMLSRRRRGWSAPPFGPRRFLTAPALTALTVGVPIFRNGLNALLRGSVNADTLSSLAIVASLLAGKDLSALVIILLADLGEMVTAYSAERSRQAIANMLSVGEPYVWQVRPDGQEVKVPLERIQAGDVVAVRTGEKISVDGVVTDGEASVDQASITGEFMPMQKRSGGQVFAGTVVKRGRLVVRAEQVGDATAVARIIHMVEEASQRKAPIQNFADKFSQQLVPISFLMAGLVYLITRDLNRALNMLIIDYSCGVRLSTATAFSGSVFNAARQGILVKGGNYLELLNDIDTLVLDKTGTVTEGKPAVIEIQPAGSDGKMTEREVLVWAAAAEQHATHPLADAVMSYTTARGWDVPKLESEEIVVAQGVEARADGCDILVGSRRFLGEKGVALDAMLLQADRMIRDGQNVLYVALDGELIGLIGVQDALREDMKKALNRLRRLAIDDVILLTGDIEHSAEQIATRLAVDRFRANVVPEDKAEMVRRLQAKGVQVTMVGDGVNDAPALAYADVGIAIGSRGTDIAIETADVTIAGDDPLKIPALIQISRQTMNIVRQNFAVAVGVNTLGIVLGALGYITPMAAAVLHNMTTVAVVLNSTRLLVYKPK